MSNASRIALLISVSFKIVFLLGFLLPAWQRHDAAWLRQAAFTRASDRFQKAEKTGDLEGMQRALAEERRFLEPTAYRAYLEAHAND